MVPIDNLNNEEIENLVYKVGEIILSVEANAKQVPPMFQTGFLLLKTAHSMMGDHLTPPANPGE